MSHLFTNFVETVEEPVLSKVSPLSLFASQSSRSEEPSASVSQSSRNEQTSVSVSLSPPVLPKKSNINDLTSAQSLFMSPAPLLEEPEKPLVNEPEPQVSVNELKKEEDVLVNELKKEEQLLVNDSRYNSLELEIEKLKQLNLEDRKKLENLELEVENLKNLNRSHVNTINQLSSELNSIRMKDQELINSQANTINKLSSELNSAVSKNIFEQIDQEKSKDVNKHENVVVSDRLVALQSTIRELEELNNNHVNTIKQLNSELSRLRSTNTNNEVNLLRRKVEELSTYNQQILVHNNNLARRLMQLQSRY